MSKELELLSQRMAQLQDLRRQRDTIAQRIRTMEGMLPRLEQSVQDEQAAALPALSTASLAGRKRSWKRSVRKLWRHAINIRPP